MIILIILYVLSIFGSRFSQRVMKQKYAWPLLGGGVNLIPIMNSIIAGVGILAYMYFYIEKIDFFSNSKLLKWFNNKDIV